MTRDLAHEYELLKANKDRISADDYARHLTELARAYIDELEGTSPELLIDADTHESRETIADAH